ncbi:MAG TPA: diaminopimelate decarboxylase [Candidatus Bathyarchaeia archaeon]|nr:diaminopimelate decarboxylase [Candidatus Bathyarchaeia archaeon]
MAAHWTPAGLRRIADQVRTPFYLYDAATLRARIAAIREVTAGEGLQARYAMKACSAAKVLEEIARAGVWIDAVSGNEVLRARRAGFPMGAEPPVVLLTTDVFRDNALAVVRDERVLPNVGSPGMVRELADAGYRGPIGLRVNPGFGHGHVQACDTGGPSSKHGLWLDDVAPAAQAARRAGMSVVLLHAHVGSGPQIDELYANLQRLAHFFAGLLVEFPDCRAVNLGGGIPHSYRDPTWTPDLVPLRRLIEGARTSFSERAGRPIRVEIEPGRFFIAPAATLVARVADVKYTGSNDKGRGHGFIMVDAGFCDLVRPAMYGSFHRISVVSDAPGPEAPFAVAGPLCESGDVFTRDAAELIEPRALPTPRAGDFVLLHDAGAYGAAMSSNYNSLGRVPQIWVEDGAAYRMSRRETVEDLVRTECFERLS